MTIALYRITVLLSAALLFVIQPMFARMVLPLLGGAPAVWNTCLVFFQAALLGGYAYAHLSTAWLGARRQALVHCLLLVAPLTLLPVGLPGSLDPPQHGQPIAWLLGLLLVTVGAPFFLVSATAPLIQKWFAETGHHASGDPYFLYAASNFGSVLGLASYPLLIEPNLRLGQQAWLWTAGYLALLVFSTACAALLWIATRTRGKQPAAVLPPAARASLLPGQPAVTTRRRLRWLLLAAVPSSWLMGVTTWLSTDIAAVPLLWTIPLAAYLVSFILVFARRPPLNHQWMVRLLGVLLMLLVVSILLPAVWQVMLVHLAAFMVGAMVCHGELARDRPGTAHLTEFYFWMSAGGVLGGIFNAILAPQLFVWAIEYPLALVLACLLCPRPAALPGRADRWIKLAALAFVTLTIALLARHLQTERPVHVALAVAAAVPVLCLLYFANRPRWFAAAIAVPLVLDAVAPPFAGDVLFTGRGYFGVHRVIANADSQGIYHHLVHGATVHGRQCRAADRVCEPLTYYHPSGPLGQVFQATEPAGQPQQVAVVGLGSGAMACYAAPGRRFTFYEIDPIVEHLARTPRYFSFLSESSAPYRVILGDGRLKLAQTPQGTYGLIILDAFSSDAIPVHLLTREAMAMYFDRLRPGGLVLVHASNRHVDLEAVLGTLAADAGLHCRVRRDLQISADEFALGKTPSVYVVLARSPSDLRGLGRDPRWQLARQLPGKRPWTDDFSNLVQAINWW